MIPRAQIEPGNLYAVPILSPADAGPIRAEIAVLRVTAVTFREVAYVETRHGRESTHRCSPETFQARVGAEGAEVAAGQIAVRVPGGA